MKSGYDPTLANCVPDAEKFTDEYDLSVPFLRILYNRSDGYSYTYMLG